MEWRCRYKAVERAAVGTPGGEKPALVIDGDCAGPQRFRLQTRDYWVEGVGLVKRDVTHTSTIGVTSDRIELTAFEVLTLQEAAAQLDVDSPAARRRHLSSKAKDPDPSVRRWAVEALGTPWEREALETLLAAFQDPDEDVQVAASNAIGRSKDPHVIPVLIAALRDPRPGTRRWAAHALGSLEVEGRQDPQTVAALATLLTDRDSLVRVAGAQALGGIPSPLALEAVAPLLRDKDPSLRSVAAMSIAILAGQGVDARHLGAALRALASSDPDTHVREFARMALDSVERRAH
jgi:hypothetical protein